MLKLKLMVGVVNEDILLKQSNHKIEKKKKRPRTNDQIELFCLF